MKILYVITKANWGGAQRYVYDVAVAAKETYDVAVAYGTEGRLVEALTEGGIRTIQVAGLSRDLRIQEEWTAFKGLLELMRSEIPDILHVNSSKAGLAVLAARITGVKQIIFTAHGWAFNEKRPWWQKTVLRLLYTLTVLLCHETICVSEAVRRDIAMFPFIGHKLRVIHHGIDPVPFLTRADARKKLLPEKKTATWIGMLAELHPTKRVADAVEAMVEIKDTFKNVILVVYGEGEERAHLEEIIARRNLREHVFLLGFVPDAASHLSAFDLFLMPSRTEALAYAVIEAGYAGLPVIASRVGGIPEVVTHKETGILIPPHNPHALARATRTLLEDPIAARTLGEKLREKVTRDFSKGRMLQETFSIYDPGN